MNFFRHQAIFSEKLTKVRMYVQRSELYVRNGQILFRSDSLNNVRLLSCFVLRLGSSERILISSNPNYCKGTRTIGLNDINAGFLLPCYTITILLSLLLHEV